MSLVLAKLVYFQPHQPLISECSLCLVLLQHAPYENVSVTYMVVMIHCVNCLKTTVQILVVCLVNNANTEVQKFRFFIDIVIEDIQSCFP